MPSKAETAFLVLPDLMLFFGIIYILVIIGLKYNTTNKTDLFITVHAAGSATLF
jgi:hypothetical protein